MSLQQLRQTCPEIKLIEPSSPEYAAVREVFQFSNAATPLAIARPRDSHEVAQLVKAAVQHDIKISVRSGGHDIFGRTIVQDALTIDVRDINFVHVLEDRQSARIGGGASLDQVAKELQKEEFVTPTGLIGSVGYVGWSTLGGYGGLANHYGLGVDQILGAEVVNWSGDIVDAEPELLKGIRGGGGNFGVICSLTVKVYPVISVLAGNLIFKAGNLADTLKRYYTAVQGGFDPFPPELQIQPAVVNHPPSGKIILLLFLWSSSDIDRGLRVLQQLLSMIPEVEINTVRETKMADFIAESAAFVPAGVYGYDQTVSFGKFDGDILDTIGKHAELMPNDPSTMLSFHELLSSSPSANSSIDRNSVFPANTTHTVVEIIGSVVDQSNEERSHNWAVHCRERLRATGKAMERTYVSLTPTYDRSLQQVYGKKWDELKRLKAKFDPQGVFDLAVPRIRAES